MSKFIFILMLAFLIPTVSFANEYYWKIGQCQSGIQSEACDGKIVQLTLTDAVHYGETKLINLPPSIGTAMTLETCKKSVDDLTRGLRSFDQSNPYVSYNTSPWMIQAKNEERLAIVIKNEPNIEKCIEQHPYAVQKAEEERIQNELEAKLQSDIKIAIANCDIDFLEQLPADEKMNTYNERTACKESLSAKPENEVNKQKQSEPTIPQVVIEQSESVDVEVQKNQTVQEPVIVPNQPTPALTTEQGLNETNAAPSNNTDDTLTEGGGTEAPSEQLNEESNIAEQPTKKTSFLQRIKNFFSKWF